MYQKECIVIEIKNVLWMRKEKVSLIFPKKRSKAIIKNRLHKSRPRLHHKEKRRKRNDQAIGSGFVVARRSAVASDSEAIPSSSSSFNSTSRKLKFEVGK